MVSGGFAAPIVLQCCERLPSEDVFVLLVPILLGLVDFSVLALYWRRGYFQVAKIDDFDLLRRVAVPFIA